MGFMCTLIPHICIYINNPTELSGPVPKWMCLASAIGHLIYMVLIRKIG